MRMKKKDWKSAAMGLGLMGVAALLLLVLPGQAEADLIQANDINCSISGLADAECDGFTTAEEQNGIPLADGTTFPGSNPPNGVVVDRPSRLDEGSQDFFVVLEEAAPTNLPANTLQVLDSFLAEDGNQGDIHLHPITQAQIQAGTRANVTANQQALIIVESLDETPGENGWGFCETGLSVNELTSDCVVFSQRIVNFVTALYDDNGILKDADNRKDGDIDFDEDVRNLIIWAANHEGGHGITVRGDSALGHHYSTRDAVLMSQTVTCKAGKVQGTPAAKCVIGNLFTSQDLLDRSLRLAP